jgi:hypothetical protein
MKLHMFTGEGKYKPLTATFATVHRDCRRKSCYGARISTSTLYSYLFARVKSTEIFKCNKNGFILECCLSLLKSILILMMISNK